MQRSPEAERTIAGGKFRVEHEAVLVTQPEQAQARAAAGAHPAVSAASRSTGTAGAIPTARQRTTRAIAPRAASRATAEPSLVSLSNRSLIDCSAGAGVKSLHGAGRRCCAGG